MRRWIRPAGLALLWLALALPAAAKAPPPGRQTLAPMLERVLPAVVNIATRTRIRVRNHPLLDDPFFRRFFDLPEPERERMGVGSGVIVDARRGYIVTNHHVIDGADVITVTLRDRRRFKARVVGTDPEADVAVLQIEAKGLHAIPLGDSDTLRVGDFVVAIGSPFGLGQTVTYGIVSALGRSGLGIEGYENFIQTDASINPGNSGGPLLTTDGVLVGINAAIVGPSGGNIGIGFAIPSNMVKAIMEQLVRHGEVRRGYLGVMIQDLTPELAQAFGLQRREGAVIARVFPGSPAEKAGIRPGDVVVRADGHPIRDGASLRNAIGLVRAGESMRLEVLRDGRRKTIRVRVGDPEQSRAAGGQFSRKLAGAVLGPIPRGHALHGRLEGVAVLEVEPGSAAWRAGLRAGDVILSINRVRVTQVPDLRKAIGAPDDALLLHLLRGDEAFYVVIE
jgi:serine protease Do/serine protease DegQ